MIDVPGRWLKTPRPWRQNNPPNKSALRSCSTKDVASLSASAHAGGGAACLIRPLSQHTARFRKPELLLRMLLTRNVLLGGGLAEAISQANQNIGKKTSSSNLYT